LHFCVVNPEFGVVRLKRGAPCAGSITCATHSPSAHRYHSSMPSSRTDIRTLLAANNVVLGPMAGITEAPFRGICKRMGAGLTYTEMVSATGLHYNPDSNISKGLLTFSAEETPCAVQLFGSDPAVMAAQAMRILERCGEDVALIDINMGCPVAKVVAKSEGSALMRDPRLAAEIVDRVAAACDVPVTVKIRSGWDDTSLNAVSFAQAMVAAGASAVTVHARTRAQFYGGRADWDVIAAVKQAVSVPVIGSGDVFSAGDARDLLERTGVDGVMAARGARGNPWIFREARSLIDTGVQCAPPTSDERIDTAREHLAALGTFIGVRAYARMRKHVAWYTTGLPGATHMRDRANEAASNEDLDRLLLEYRAYLSGRPGTVG
jgi:tRNA-dihydrouridine synthase B